MADIRDKVPENAPGAYFIDSACIDCDTCRCISPENFRRNEEKAYSYLFKQPENELEVELVEEAIACCPVDAIGKEEEGA